MPGVTVDDVVSVFASEGLSSALDRELLDAAAPADKVVAAFVATDLHVDTDQGVESVAVAAFATNSCLVIVRSHPRDKTSPNPAASVRLVPLSKILEVRCLVQPGNDGDLDGFQAEFVTSEMGDIVLESMYARAVPGSDSGLSDSGDDDPEGVSVLVGENSMNSVVLTESAALSGGKAVTDLKSFTAQVLGLISSRQ